MVRIQRVLKTQDESPGQGCGYSRIHILLSFVTLTPEKGTSGQMIPCRVGFGSRLGAIKKM